jgi:hypothetical protein
VIKKSQTFLSLAVGATLFAGAISEARAENFFTNYLSYLLRKAKERIATNLIPLAPPIP